jgi:small subunit ribosomal protein S2
MNGADDQTLDPKDGTNPMAQPQIQDLLEAGVHFGHQTRRWNPKMRRFIFAERSGIYIIDLQKTVRQIQQAQELLKNVVLRGEGVLFVCTKKQLKGIVEAEAAKCGAFWVTERWLGGMLTNFQTISRRLVRLRELREMDRSGALDYLPKKEAIRLRNEKEKLERNLGGIQDLERLPDAIFVIDTKKEHIAVGEARKLGLPVIAIVDTNCDPDEVDFVIPGNDDAIRSVGLVARVLSDAIEEGRRGTGSKLEPEIELEPAVVAEEIEVAVEADGTVEIEEAEVVAEPDGSVEVVVEETVIEPDGTVETVVEETVAAPEPSDGGES